MNDRQLALYLERIGHGWNVRPDVDTLRSIHRAHVTSIPFEALDAQLGTVPSLDPAAIFAKLVERPRGGWCYEMNGLFGAALEAIGFPVTRLSCAVMRQDGGDARLGTHLALLVECDGPRLCDVGFGGSLLEPLQLAAGEWQQAPYALSLEQTGDGYWRFTERLDRAFGYDFRAEPADEALFAEKCRWQASDPESNFTRNLVAQKRSEDGHLILRGRVLTEHGPHGTITHTLGDADELVTVLSQRFGIDELRAREAWPRIVARHRELFDEAA
jgi:N-hydroxyarylamine O-acetyltransferase